MDFFKIAMLKLDNIDWNTDSNGYYKKEYIGKILISNDCIWYCPPSGKHIYSVMTSSDDTFNGGEKFNAEVFWKQLLERELDNSRNRSERKVDPLDIQQLVHLKASGHSVDEIIKLKKEGVL